MEIVVIINLNISNMKIANIIYENELVNHTEVNYINYINKPVKYMDLNETIPTLYVGWSFMKSCNPNDLIVQSADVLENRIITNQLYWERSFIEGKAEHVNGIEKFVNDAPDLYFSPKYSYINLDPIFFQIKDIDELLNILPKSLISVYLLKGEMLYVLANDPQFGNKIWGINLVMYEYFQFNIIDIIEKINERTHNVIKDNDGEKYVEYRKLFPNFTNLKRYMVTLL